MKRKQLRRMTRGDALIGAGARGNAGARYFVNAPRRTRLAATSAAEALLSKPAREESRSRLT